MKRFIAFTLAETLIVIGVIGLVSALTLPNLNSSTGEKEKVAKVKKIYQNLTDAVGRAEAVYGPIDEWGGGSFAAHGFQTEDGQKWAARITEFLKTSSIQYSNADIILSTNEGKLDSISCSCTLADGTQLYFGSEFFEILVDIDGKTKGGKPTSGKDLFAFTFLQSSKVTTEIYPDGNNSSCFSSGHCTDWVIKYGNMDYLKANSTGVCKNNSSISLDGTTNTTCK